MSGRVYVAPDGKEFKTRKAAKEHQVKNKLAGAISVAEVEDKPKKTETSKKGKAPTAGKRYGKPWQCPQCKKTFKKEKAAISHMKAKLHGKQPIYIPDQGRMMDEKTKKEEAQKKEEEARKAKEEAEKKAKEQAEKKAKEDAIEIYRKIPEFVYNNLMLVQEQWNGWMQILTNPENDGKIIYSKQGDHEKLDWLKFQLNFTEIEMENSDLLFCLSRLNPMSVLNCYDTIGMDYFGIIDVEDDKIIVNHDSSVGLEVSVIAGRLSEAPLNKLACVSGMWEEDKSQPEEKEEEKEEEKKEEVKENTETAIVLVEEDDNSDQTYLDNFQDWQTPDKWDETWRNFIAEEERYGGGYGHGHYGGYWDDRQYPYGRSSYQSSYKRPPPPAPPILEYPVYGVSSNHIYVYRIIPYEIYE
jgi:uncharacterized C2H2 Zn-finger protein